jgi:hypothetical protein
MRLQNAVFRMKWLMLARTLDQAVLSARHRNEAGARAGGASTHPAGDQVSVGGETFVVQGEPEWRNRL